MKSEYSVLMSVYKEEKPDDLIHSIKSMLNQTLKPDEFVMVKDGSLTDELDEIIEKYQLEYPSIFKIIELKENIGLGKALDIGIEHCSNELIARMDADDISLPTRCEQQVEMFNYNSSLSIVGTKVDEFYDDPTKIVSSRAVPTEQKDIVKFVKRRSPFNHPTVMYKKSDVIKFGGYGKMRRKQDLDLFSRMINNGCIGANIDESLLLFRSNEDNFERRKSWSYCKSYIEVQYEILKRRHCSIFDFLYVTVGQLFMYIAPMKLVKYISNKYLREIPEYDK